MSKHQRLALGALTALFALCSAWQAGVHGQPPTHEPPLTAPGPQQLPPLPPGPPAVSLPVPSLPAVAGPSPQDPPVPVVVLRVRVLACVAVGQEIEYHFCV